MCVVLRLDKDYLLASQKSHQYDIRHSSRAFVEDQDPIFYSKVAQVQGPKFGNEVEALDAWIHYF